jgi:hypothetical protein
MRSISKPTISLVFSSINSAGGQVASVATTIFLGAGVGVGVGVGGTGVGVGVGGTGVGVGGTGVGVGAGVAQAAKKKTKIVRGKAQRFKPPISHLLREVLEIL